MTWIAATRTLQDLEELAWLQLCCNLCGQYTNPNSEASSRRPSRSGPLFLFTVGDHHVWFASGGTNNTTTTVAMIIHLEVPNRWSYYCRRIMIREPAEDDRSSLTTWASHGDGRLIMIAAVQTMIMHKYVTWFGWFEEMRPVEMQQSRWVCYPIRTFRLSDRWYYNFS